MSAGARQRGLHLSQCHPSAGAHVAGMGLHMGVGYTCCRCGSAEPQIDVSLSQQTSFQKFCLISTECCQNNAHAVVLTQIKQSLLQQLPLCKLGSQIWTICMCAASSGGHLSVKLSPMQLKQVAKMPEVPTALLQQTNVSKYVRVWLSQQAR